MLLRHCCAEASVFRYLPTPVHFYAVRPTSYSQPPAPSPILSPSDQSDTEVSLQRASMPRCLVLVLLVSVMEVRLQAC